MRLRSRRFERELDAQALARHQRIVDSVRRSAFRPVVPPMPVGFRAQDVLGRLDGFVPLELAAEQMGTSEQAIVEHVRSGLLEAYQDGGLMVRPAIVSVFGVDDRG